MVVMIIRPAAVDPQREKQFTEVSVIRRDQPAVAHSPEIFRRKKTEGPRIPEGPGVSTAATGADGLAGVFKDLDAASISQFHDGLHIGTLTEEMHGDDGFRTRRDLPLDLFGINRKRIGSDVHEHRHRVQTRDAARRRKESKRHGDHFIAGFHPRRH